MTAKVPTTLIGSARLGITVAETLRRKKKITSTTRPKVSSSVHCTSLTESLIDLGAVVEHVHAHRRRQLLAQDVEGLPHRLGDGDRVGARLALDRQDDAPALGAPGREPGGGLVVLDAVEHLADVLEPHRRAAAVRDDQLAKAARVLELPGGAQRQRLLRAPERAGREVHVPLVDRVRDLVDADLLRRRAAAGRAGRAPRTSATRRPAPGPRPGPSRSAAPSGSRRTR